MLRVPKEQVLQRNTGLLMKKTIKTLLSWISPAQCLLTNGAAPRSSQNSSLRKRVCSHHWCARAATAGRRWDLHLRNLLSCLVKVQIGRVHTRGPRTVASASQCRAGSCARRKAEQEVQVLCRRTVQPPGQRADRRVEIAVSGRRVSHVQARWTKAVAWIEAPPTSSVSQKALQNFRQAPAHNTGAKGDPAIEEFKRAAVALSMASASSHQTHNCKRLMCCS